MSFDILRSWIDESSHVLVAAGAGMSAAAGLDYGDQKRFGELFPAFVRKGFTARYQAIGYQGWTPQEHWAYWAIHVADICKGARNDAPYRQLLEVVGDKDVFVYTSNVDRLFPRNGFDPQKLFTPQGDYGQMQCCRACKPVTWDSAPIIQKLLDAMDPVEQVITDLDALPRCPNCGGEVFLNVRVDGNFVEAPYAAQSERFQGWLDTALDERFLVIEIGAGYNTPSVIRYPCEGLVARHSTGRLLRINQEYPDVPRELGDRAMGIREDAAIFLAGFLASS